MGNTWIIDMRHYLDEDECLADMHNQAVKLALFFGSIVAWMTSHDADPDEPTNVVCRRSPGRRPCVGEIFADFEEERSAIAWVCPLCGDNGIIRGWKDTLWDRGTWSRYSAGGREPTPTELDRVRSELVQKEAILHQPFGSTRRDLENLLAPGFREVGASGRRYNRDFALDTLQRRQRNPSEEFWEAKDFHCSEIAPDHYLLTYTLCQGERATRRSTIWRRTPAGWSVLYHQGTLVGGS